MKKILAAAVGCLVVWPLAVAQASAENSVAGARAALIKFIELSDRQALRSEQARRLLVAEAARWEVPTFGRLAGAPDKVVLLDRDSAVGRVQWFGENDYVADMYFYLEFDGAWKISAMRRLALTGLVEHLSFALKAKKTLTAEEKATLANIELVLAPDQVLKEWFARNRESLDKLYGLAHAKAGGGSLHIGDGDKRFPEVAESLRRLHLSGVNTQANGNAEITIGGVMDNTVGFICSPTKSPPPISPSSYIWVEEVADGWYLFRTT